jgi:hypothetical protein
MVAAPLRNHFFSLILVPVLLAILPGLFLQFFLSVSSIGTHGLIFV